MSSLKPVIHGRDHLPGGADPIPVAALQAVFFNAATEWMQVTTVTIDGSGGDNEATLALSHLSGPVIASTGSVSVKGVYTIDVVALAEGGATTHNHFTLEVNMVQAAYTAALFAQEVSVDELGFLPEGCVSITGVMNVGDSFLLKIANWDTASRDFSCPSVRVTRILELP